MDARVFTTEILGKCGVFWYQLKSESEAYNLHIVTLTYCDVISGSDRTKFWLVVPTMFRVILRELINVWLDAET